MVLARLTADALVLAHLGFILFVVLGGLLVLRWPRVAFVHVPAAVWGVLIELSGWLCPLTPLENMLRAMGGQARYEDGFIAHYVLPIIYPAGLTREVQLILAAAVVAINGLVYARVIARWRSGSPPHRAATRLRVEPGEEQTRQQRHDVPGHQRDADGQ